MIKDADDWNKTTGRGAIRKRALRRTAIKKSHNVFEGKLGQNDDIEDDDDQEL